MTNVKELEAFMDLFFKVHREMDHEKLISLYSFPLVSIGTSRHEFNEYLSASAYKDNQRSDYQKVIAMRIEEILPRYISTESDNAWVATRFSVWIKDSDKNDIVMHCRLTLILKKIDQQWLIVHQHYSVPDHMADKQEAYPGQIV